MPRVKVLAFAVWRACRTGWSYLLCRCLAVRPALQTDFVACNCSGSGGRYAVDRRCGRRGQYPCWHDDCCSYPLVNVVFRVAATHQQMVFGVVLIIAIVFTIDRSSSLLK